MIIKLILKINRKVYMLYYILYVYNIYYVYINFSKTLLHLLNCPSALRNQWFRCNIWCCYTVTKRHPHFFNAMITDVYELPFCYSLCELLIILGLQILHILSNSNACYVNNFIFIELQIY